MCCSHSFLIGVVPCSAAGTPRRPFNSGLRACREGVGDSLCPIYLTFRRLLSRSSQSFVPRATFAPRVRSTPIISSSSNTELFGCRTNAKKEKIKRNRENMRKFKTGGRKGLSRRKLLKKAQSARARQEEAEFVAKCFQTVPAPSSEDDDKN